MIRDNSGSALSLVATATDNSIGLTFDKAALADRCGTLIIEHETEKWPRLVRWHTIV
jgi:hypothetical protein